MTIAVLTDPQTNEGAIGRDFDNEKLLPNRFRRGLQITPFLFDHVIGGSVQMHRHR